MRPAWLLAAALLLVATGCEKSRRDPGRGDPAAARVTPRDAGLAAIRPVDAAPPDAARPALDLAQQELAAAVLAEVREVSPGHFVLPAAVHRMFMRDHLGHISVMGHAEFGLLVTGKRGLRVSLGPSPILHALGLQDGDTVVKIHGRLAANMLHTEEALLRVLLLLGDGELDLEIDRGPAPTRIKLNYKIR